jgi:hypothetical protein
MTSLPLNEDLKTSQFPRQDSRQREHNPEHGTTFFERLNVRVASFPPGARKFISFLLSIRS